MIGRRCLGQEIGRGGVAMLSERGQKARGAMRPQEMREINVGVSRWPRERSLELALVETCIFSGERR